jgi:hypothetical protein
MKEPSWYCLLDLQLRHISIPKAPLMMYVLLIKIVVYRVKIMVFNATFNNISDTIGVI